MQRDARWFDWKEYQAGKRASSRSLLLGATTLALTQRRLVVLQMLQAYIRKELCWPTWSSVLDTNRRKVYLHWQHCPNSPTTHAVHVCVYVQIYIVVVLDEWVDERDVF